MYRAKNFICHESIVDEFNKKFAIAVDNLKYGLPWEKDAFLTPLPEPHKANYMQDLIHDAVKKVRRLLIKKVEHYLIIICIRLFYILCLQI